MDFVEKINIGLTSSGSFTSTNYISYFSYLYYLAIKSVKKKLNVFTNPTRFANYLYASTKLESVKNLYKDVNAEKKVIFLPR